MARSTYIYLLFLNGKVVAAFTVKRELLAHLIYLRQSIWEGVARGYAVWRVLDGKHVPIDDITEQVQQEITELEAGQ